MVVVRLAGLHRSVRTPRCGVPQDSSSIPDERRSGARSGAARGYQVRSRGLPTDPHAPAAPHARAARPGARDTPRRERAGAPRCSSRTAFKDGRPSKRRPGLEGRLLDLTGRRRGRGSRHARAAGRAPVRHPGRQGRGGLGRLGRRGRRPARHPRDQGRPSRPARDRRTCACASTPSHGHCGLLRADGSRRQRRHARACSPAPRSQAAPAPTWSRRAT